jgi:hypothetical protein
MVLRRPSFFYIEDFDETYNGGRADILKYSPAQFLLNISIFGPDRRKRSSSNNDRFDRKIRQKIEQSIKHRKMNNKEDQEDGVQDENLIYKAASGSYDGYQQGLCCSGDLCMGEYLLFNLEVKCGGCNRVVHTMCSHRIEDQESNLCFACDTNPMASSSQDVAGSSSDEC